MSSARQITDEYLQRHDLAKQLESMLNDLLKVRPSNPWHFLAQACAAKASAQALYEVVFILGGPGSGKGTQCTRIVEEFGFVHLSAGELLREAKEGKGDPVTSELILKCMTEGKIVPVEITVQLLRTAMEEAAKQGKHRFLVDGFPRNADNFSGWEKIMGPVAGGPEQLAHVRFVLFLDCPEETMRQRLLGRGQGRPDDNEATITKRFATYLAETMPVIEIFEKMGKLRRVSSVPTADEVFSQVKELFTA